MRKIPNRADPYSFIPCVKIRIPQATAHGGIKVRLDAIFIACFKNCTLSQRCAADFSKLSKVIPLEYQWSLGFVRLAVLHNGVMDLFQNVLNKLYNYNNHFIVYCCLLEASNCLQGLSFLKYDLAIVWKFQETSKLLFSFHQFISNSDNSDKL